MTYIFGPVPSRRLGRSLGVDLVPFKTCSYDCIYCQLGRTTNQTVERREWVPLDAVLAELRGKLASQPDYITLSGSGEPTLYSRLDELIDGIRAMTEVPIAVLTNGSLLWQPEVRSKLLRAHLVIPSLDAGDERTFQAIDRPHGTISFKRMLWGLIDFRREYQGQYWLEVFCSTAAMRTAPSCNKSSIASNGSARTGCSSTRPRGRRPRRSRTGSSRSGWPRSPPGSIRRPRSSPITAAFTSKPNSAPVPRPCWK